MTTKQPSGERLACVRAGCGKPATLYLAEHDYCSWECMARVDERLALAQSMAESLGCVDEWRAICVEQYAAADWPTPAPQPVDSAPQASEGATEDVGRCRYGDPACPCQDGDACHYEDVGDTKAMDVPPEYVRRAIEWERERIIRRLQSVAGVAAEFPARSVVVPAWAVSDLADD